MTEAERTTIAYHESGHALVGHILEHSIRFIRFRLSAAARLWATLQLPQDDHFLKTKNEMPRRACRVLGRPRCRGYVR